MSTLHLTSRIGDGAGEADVLLAVDEQRARVMAPSLAIPTRPLRRSRRRTVGHVWIDWTRRDTPLTGQLGRSPDDYEQWLQQRLVNLLLEDH